MPWTVQTPDTLLRRDVYTSIAVPLRGGPLRSVSLAMLVSGIADNRGVENIFGAEASELKQTLPMKFKSRSIQELSAGRKSRVSRFTAIPFTLALKKSKDKTPSSDKYDVAATSRDASSPPRGSAPAAVPAAVFTDMNAISAGRASLSDELRAGELAELEPPDYDTNYGDGSGMASPRSQTASASAMAPTAGAPTVDEDAFVQAFMEGMPSEISFSPRRSHSDI
mmetsp:Transcript_24311/g.48665  ORF Transcript_24311/g.48665 Transcript_24311/m.48665 type:complete len:224 (-) Transcript_24311:803-1474(-)